MDTYILQNGRPYGAHVRGGPLLVHAYELLP